VRWFLAAPDGDPYEYPDTDTERDADCRDGEDADGCR
jgi:hypothetical protein